MENIKGKTETEPNDSDEWKALENLLVEAIDALADALKTIERHNAHN